MKLSFVYQVLEYAFKQEEQEITNVVIDSRETQEGDIFFAIQGKRFDGHQFIEEVLRKNVVAVVASNPVYAHPKVILVKDTVQALGRLAKAWRKKINPYILGITGSNGKTTVKELASTVLQTIYGEKQVLATRGNLNNHLGVPLTLLKLSPLHKFAVIEMGMNHFGELAYLTQIVEPNVALVNNVLRAHIGCGFNGLRDIALAKAEIFQGLTKNGTIVLPKDDSQFQLLLQKALFHKIRTFGLNNADITATQIKMDVFTSSCQLQTPLGISEVTIPMPGLHNVYNVLAVCGLLMDIPNIHLFDIVKGITCYRSTAGRLSVFHLKNGSILIDDSYNANPDSMRASLNVLAKMPYQTIFIMGDMGELDKNAPDLHKEMGSYANQLGIHYLLGVGAMTKLAVEAFGENSLHFAEKGNLMKKLQTMLNQKSSILVKGSRFMEMEGICQALKEKIGCLNK